MIGLKLEPYIFEEKFCPSISIPFHPSFYATYKNLKRWLDRFDLFVDESILGDLVLFFSLAKKKYLDHRDPEHLTRLIISIYLIQKKLLGSASLFTSNRHLIIRWIPTDLLFPFSSKPVLGCLIGFNVMDRCELFDEENILVSLQKHFPDLQLVKESYHKHTSQNEKIRICYFEIEKKNGVPFSLTERKYLSNHFKEKIKNSIQKLIPSMFMNLNQEEVYKNILILSQEISSIHDLPQVCLTLDQHNRKEIVFHITVVNVSSIKNLLSNDLFKCERTLPVRHLDGKQIEAHLLKISLPCEASLLRSDGSLDFYAARQKVTNKLLATIGEFRDYNGGLLIKQQELLFSFKESLPEVARKDSEFMETFFHALVPLEKQALLDPSVLSILFTHYTNHAKETIISGFSLKMLSLNGRIFISVRSLDSSVTETITATVLPYLSKTKEWAYNILETPEETSFNCVLLNGVSEEAQNFVHALQAALNEWNEKRESQKILRIALGHTMFSLDPRIGGENVSREVLKLLFEGLTRFNAQGKVENALAESIEISSDLKTYTFYLRPSFWNDGSIVSAHDFAYSWKRILSPDFKTNFATYFYPIKNAKEAKEGKVSPEEIGVHVIDDRILQVNLVRPSPYFLQFTTLPIFSPIHRFIDQEKPQWPYEAGTQYPCNGPYQLKINEPNQAYRLVKNPLYWNASQTELDQITLTSMDTFQAIHSFTKNEVDWIGAPFGAYHPISIPEDAKNIYSPNNSLSWLLFNTLTSPFNNEKIRRALSLSIDRQALIKEISFHWTPAYSILFPRNNEPNRSVFPPSNREEAIDLLYEGLKETGLSLKDLSIQLTFPHKSVLEAAAHLIKRQLEKYLNIECQLQSFAWSSFFHKMSEGQFQIALVNWTTPINDPIGMLNTFKFSKEGVNFSRWEDPEFQHLLDLSEEERDPQQREHLLMNAEKILANTVPVIPLFYQEAQAIVRNKPFFHHQSVPSGLYHPVRTFYQRK